jgi:folylpolyglutamate synthase/dihydrofolate synthase
MIELGLGRIGRLLRHTPQPWRAVHVAGTNGKGSICAYLSSMLRASGVRVGQFNSPHLIDRWDCVRINEEAVRESLFLEAEKLVKERDQAEGLRATEFELLTATAFEVFTKEEIEIGVVEVGLGGRIDATNALHHKAVTVISKIGMDHQSFLGNTIQEIAREKAGIMRPGVPCVLDRSNPPEVHEVVEGYAREIGTEVILSSIEPSLLEELSPSNFPQHQWENLACAYAAFRLVHAKPQSPHTSLATAIKNVTWPGRLQTVDVRRLTGRREPVLLDGAHNPQAADVLGSYVDERLRKASKTTWILAASNGKELDGILKPLLRPGDCVAAVKFGPVDGMPWVEAMAPQDILAAASAFGIDTSLLHNAGSDISGALRWAVTAAEGGPLVIAGSLYLVSDVLRLLRNAEQKN